MSWFARLLSPLDIAPFVGPSIDFTFTLHGDLHMPLAGTATVTLAAPDPRLSIASRPVVVTVGSAAPITLDAINGPVTFPCNEDDTGTITAQDVTKGGVASPETTYSFTAIDKATIPAAPGVTFSFVVDAAPAPAAS